MVTPEQPNQLAARGDLDLASDIAGLDRLYCLVLWTEQTTNTGGKVYSVQMEQYICTVPLLRMCGFCTLTSTHGEKTVLTSFSARQQYLPASSLARHGMTRVSAVWSGRGMFGALNQRKLGLGTPVALHSRTSC